MPKQTLPDMMVGLTTMSFSEDFRVCRERDCDCLSRPDRSVFRDGDFYAASSQEDRDVLLDAVAAYEQMKAQEREWMAGERVETSPAPSSETAFTYEPTVRFRLPSLDGEFARISEGDGYRDWRDFKGRSRAPSPWPGKGRRMAFEEPRDGSGRHRCVSCFVHAAKKESRETRAVGKTVLRFAKRCCKSLRRK